MLGCSQFHPVGNVFSINGPESFPEGWCRKKLSVRIGMRSRRQPWPVFSQSSLWFSLVENLLELLVLSRCSCFSKESQLKERHPGHRGGHPKWNGFLKKAKEQKSSSFGMLQHMFQIWKHCAEGRQGNKLCRRAWEMCGNVFVAGGFNHKSFLPFSYAVSLSLKQKEYFQMDGPEQPQIIFVGVSLLLPMCISQDFCGCKWQKPNSKIT